MKITIDTKEDSHEEIKKAISMLQQLIGGHTNIQPTAEPDSAATAAFADMFSTASTQNTQETKEPENKEEETPTETEKKASKSVMEY